MSRRLRKKNAALRAELRKVKLLAEKRANPEHRAAGEARISIARAEGQGLVIAATTGRYARKHPVILRLPDEDLVGAIESPPEFGGVLAKIGMLALAAVVNNPLTEGPEGLARDLAKWARIDIEALRREMAEDNEAAAAPPAFTGSVEEFADVLDGPTGGDPGAGADSGPADGPAPEAVSSDEGMST